MNGLMIGFQTCIWKINGNIHMAMGIKYEMNIYMVINIKSYKIIDFIIR